MKSFKNGTKKNGIIGLAIMLIVSVLVIFGSDAADKKIAEWEAAKSDKEATSTLKDGTYTAEDADFDSSGYKGIVTMEVKGGEITALTYDCIDKDGNKKSQLSMDGKYVMTEDGPKWHEQAEELAKYVIENQSVDGLKMDEDGKTDAIASVSIKVDGFVNLVKDCLAQAAGKAEEVTSTLKDGTYTAEDADFDS
ncbi:MAG: hypothetical protein ACLRZ7_08975, partial [Lachnospiraceae bacterium]